MPEPGACRLGIRENAFVPEHPDIAISLTNLGVLYRDKSRYSDAEPLLRLAPTIREKVFT